MDPLTKYCKMHLIFFSRKDNRPNGPASIVEGLIWAGQIIQVVADVGETMFVCCLAAGIASGGMIMSKFKCANPTGVLYFQGGMSYEELARRIYAFSEGTTAFPVKILSPELFNDDVTANLADENFQDILGFYLENSKKYGLVVFDSITPYIKEIAEERKILRLLYSLRRLGITTISVISKNDGGLQIPLEQTDTIIKIRKMDGFENLVLQCGFQKARSIRQEDQESFFLELAEKERGKMSLKEVVLDNYLKAKVVQLSVNGWSQPKIGKKIGKHQSTISRWIHKWALPDSLIAKDGKKYLLTVSGEKLLEQYDLDSQL